MKTIHLIITFIAIISTAELYAQNNYELSNYKFPDVRREGLDLNFNSAGSTIMVKPDSLQPKLGNFNAVVNLNYTHFFNTRREQRNTLASLNFSGYRLLEDDGIKNTARDLGAKLSLQHNHLFFFNNLHYGGDLYLNYAYINSKFSYGDTMYQSEEYHRNNVDFALPLKVGYGRIERVSDYRMAIYVYEDLKNNGKVNTNKSEADVMQLASFISELKSERIYDHRLAKMKHLKALDTYLRENNFLIETDIDYFNILNDYWDYGFHALRTSGFMASAVFYPSYSTYHSRVNLEEQNADNKNKQNAVGLGGGVEIKYDKPINLSWQSNLFFNSYIGQTELSGDNYDSVNFKYPNYYAQLGHQIAWYPNTRTELSLAYTLDYSALLDGTNPETLQRNLEASVFTLNVRARLNYYFSDRLKAVISAGLDQQLNESDQHVYSFKSLRNTFPLINRISINDPFYIDRKFGLSYNLQLTYSIF